MMTQQNTRKKYTPEFKAQAMELVHAGKPVKEVADELEIEISNLYGWLKKARDEAELERQMGNPAATGNGQESATQELARLRRENKRLAVENDILKKAAIILGTEPQSGAKTRPHRSQNRGSIGR
jgi:transposase